MPLRSRRTAAQTSSLRSPEALHSKASGAFDPTRGGRLLPRAPPPRHSPILFSRGFRHAEGRPDGRPCMFCVVLLRGSAYFSRSEMTCATFTPEAPAWAASSQSPLLFASAAGAAKAACAPLLLLSGANPLRWALLRFPPQAAVLGRPGPPGAPYFSRSEMTCATFTPEAPAWARPRVTPAPSPMAKKLGMAVSSSGERARRDE